MDIEVILKFMEKWCPDFEQQESWETAFELSIQVFADKLCKKQRKYCANAVFEDVEDLTYNDILNAETPKIEDL